MQNLEDKSQNIVIPNTFDTVGNVGLGVAIGVGASYLLNLVEVDDSIQLGLAASGILIFGLSQIF